jgi:type I site-specific restriction-modification system R (restriction) subunit
MEQPVTENATIEKKAVPSQSVAEDLSKEIEQSMERQQNERIKVMRVFSNCYRCNWWLPDKTPHLFWLPTGKISKSRFVRATKTSDGLLIEDVH